MKKSHHLQFVQHKKGGTGRSPFCVSLVSFVVYITRVSALLNVVFSLIFRLKKQKYLG